jgi:hypothetical protein
MVMDYLGSGFYVNGKKLQRYDCSHLRSEIRFDGKPQKQLWHSVCYVCMAYTR